MKKTLLALAVMFAAAGCSDNRYPQAVAPAPVGAPVAAAPAAAAPVIINQAPAANSGVGDMLMGGALGYMMGRSSSNNGSNGTNGGDTHRTINKTVINKTVIVQQQPKKAEPASPQPPKQSFGRSYGDVYGSKPAVPARKQSFGGYPSARPSGRR